MPRMPSADGGVFVAPPGNASVGPLVRCTLCASATTAVGVPLIPRGTEPIHSQCPGTPSGNASGLNEIDVSGGAGSNGGDSIFSKCVNGCASSPGGALSAARLRRYSGTRISTFFRKTVRVPAALAPQLLIVVWSSVNCYFASGGQSAERAL